MGPNVARGLKESGAIPKEGDGVAPTAAIRDGLEIGPIRIALQHPFLGTLQAPICLLVGVDDRELVFQIVTSEPIFRREACRVRTKVQGLDGGQQGLLALAEISSKV